MQKYEHKNLLIIYQNSTRHINTGELEGLFNIILIPKVQRIDFKDFKLKGNHLVTRYNDILYTANADFVFFICSSEFNHTVCNTLLNFNGLEKDFDFFTGKKANNLITSLSGLVAKKEVLIGSGFFGKHIFNNLYLNFLINYSCFFGLVPESAFYKLKTGSPDFMNYIYWTYYEKPFYLRQPLYEKNYLMLSNKMEAILVNNIYKKMIVSFMKRKMSASLSEIENIVQTNTCLEYW